MKKKIILLTASIAFLFCSIYAQRIDKQQVFVATTEEEVYKLYEQMLDSVKVSNKFLQPSPQISKFGIGFFDEIESRDTIMKFVQRCKWNLDDEFVCDRFFRSYISNNMPVAFYEHFLNYLKEVGKRRNYFVKYESTVQLWYLTNILIKQYESGNLSESDSKKALQLIEETDLRRINEAHRYGINDKYMTDKIRQALVNAIENPFYPTEYLDFFMSQQDTTVIDTAGINTKNLMLWKVNATPEELEKYERDSPLIIRWDSFLMYERIGKEEYNGLSAGQAYLKKKEEGFPDKGYLPIHIIAEYAYQKQDKLLIEHLEKFKKKHPDFPKELKKKGLSSKYF